jgi:Protein of unknown function (DUF3352)
VVEPERRGPRWLIVALAAVLVVGIGGGAWAFAALRSSGQQPERVLPGNAIAYVRVDLDPSASQKLAILDFARKFPAAKERLGSGDDLRKSLFEAMRSDDESLKNVDYDADIAPWLGDRAAVAAVPGADGKEPTAVGAVQVTDEAKAKAGVDKLRPEGDETGYAFVDGYLIIADTQSAADRFAASATDNTLADNEQFQDDMDALGETGVFSFWFDSAKLAEVGGSGSASMPLGLGQDTGRVVGALTFEDSAAQLKAVARGATVPTFTDSGIRLAELPASTVAGVSVAGAGEAFAKAWPKLQGLVEQFGQSAQLDSMLRAADQQFGIKLPDDLVTLLGTDLTFGVDEEGLAEAVQATTSGGTEPALPQAGFRSTTDVAKAKALLPKLEQMMAASGAPVEFGKAAGSDSVAIATSQAYADKLVKGGTLGESETFKAAVVDSGEAQYGLFLDLDKLEKFYPAEVPEKERANLEALKAIGLSGTTTEDGGTFTARVLVN